MIAVKAALAVEAGTFNTSLKDLVILVRGKSGDVLEDIFIYDSRSKEEPKVLLAREGRLSMKDDFTLGLSLTDGYINILKGSNIIELFFDRYQFTLTLSPYAPALKKFELMPAELMRKIRETKEDKERISLYLELHRRLALPVICLVLILLAPPLSLMSGKSGKLLGLTIGLTVFAGYYVLQIYFESLALQSRIPHYAGAWATTLLLGVIGLALYRRESAR
jgi:lipopolysaccharide export system permease protein